MKIYQGTYRGVPYDISATLIRGRYEVVVWINPTAQDVANGMPFGHKTMFISPAKWTEWKAQLEANQLPMNGVTNV